MGETMGRKQTHKVVLTPEEREYLIKNTKSGTWSPREVKRAQILLSSDNETKHDQEISRELCCYPATITKLRERFAKERLGVIHDKERSGRPRIVDGDVEAHVVAIVCS